MIDSSEEVFGREIQRQTSMTLGTAMVAVVTILVFAVGQGFRFGFGAADYMLLIAGSIVSMVAMFGYAMISVMRAYGSPKQAWMGLAAFGGLLLYLFFLYVFFYRGLWSFAALADGFSFRPILRAGAFCMLSYHALRQFYKITELGKVVDEIARKAEEQ
jgi:hypothetical protein